MATFESRTTINFADVQNVVERIDSLNRRAAKLGQPTISYGFTNWGMLTVRRRVGREVAIVGVEVIDVIITGTIPGLDGWSFIATIEPFPQGDGNLVHAIPDVEVDPRWRTEKSHCDHCNTIRNRNETYVLRHEDGREVMVGSTCISDYLGNKDVHKYTEMLGEIRSILRFLDDHSHEYGFGDDYDGDGFFMGRCTSCSITDFLAWVAATIERFGWLSRTRARETGMEGRATADIAVSQLDSYTNPYCSDKPQPPEAHHIERAKKALTWMRTEEAVRQCGDSEYAWNLRQLCQTDYIDTADPRHTGLVASLFSARARALSEDVTTGRENITSKTSTHQGSLKERRTWEKLTVLEARPMESFYGSCILYKFTDVSGNIFSWFCTGRVDLDPGAVVDLKGTVKEHKVYKNVAETQLNRCAVEKTYTA